MAPRFGADAAELLAMDGVMSADVTASIANDAARLPAGSVIVVDDFHPAAAAARPMTDLVERWPGGSVTGEISVVPTLVDLTAFPIWPRCGGHAIEGGAR